MTGVQTCALPIYAYRHLRRRNDNRRIVRGQRKRRQRCRKSKIDRRAQDIGQSADTGKPAAAGGKAVYDTNCQACHAAGVAGAPKLGDKAAWAPRLGAGAAALTASAIKGKNAMPPKGGNLSLADGDIKAAVDYMVSQSK